MKDSQNIDEIITAVLSGRYSEEEFRKLEEWKARSADNEAQLNYLEKIWKERSNEPDFLNSEELAEKIWNEGVRINAESPNIKHRQVIRYDLGYMIKIAAVFVIFVLTPYLLYLFRGEPATPLPIADVNVIVTKSNPAGQKTRISLPDGSVAWLNSLSSISYPAYFSDTARMIDLIGEAYFEVKKDSLRPFTVRSGSIYTTALGTSFNISAYANQNDIQIGLITGMIRVRDAESSDSIILEPNSGAIYRKNDKLMIEVIIDPAMVLAWKNGVLRFDGENFETFISKLEQWYGVKIIVEGEPPQDWRIRAKFADEYLTNILNSISFNKDFSYKINRKEVVFTFK